jgi:hypothetical protein
MIASKRAVLTKVGPSRQLKSKNMKVTKYGNQSM